MEETCVMESNISRAGIRACMFSMAGWATRKGEMGKGKERGGGDGMGMEALRLFD